MRRRRQPVASCSDLPRGLSIEGGPVDVFTVVIMSDENPTQTREVEICTFTLSSSNPSSSSGLSPQL